MEFRDLKKQYKVLENSINKAVIGEMTEGHFIAGKSVRDLEERLAAYVGKKHCITCGNGTDALSVALMAWNIGSGDAIFVPDFTFFATAEVVAFCGATPVFVDVYKTTCNIDCEKLEKAIKDTIDEEKLCPKAIIAVDLFGQPADYTKISKIAEKYNLKILEDGAQGFGGSINNKKACSFGHISTTSFFPAKPVGCYGDGGAIFTDNDEWAELIRSICVHGKGKYKYDNIRIGINSRLDTLQAAILQVKLDAFENYELNSINKAATYYTKYLQNVVSIPEITNNFISSWAQYVIQLPNEVIRDRIQVQLREQAIPSMVYYPKPLHEQVAFSNYSTNQKELQISKILSQTVLALPIHPYITQEEQDLVVNAIKKLLQ